MIKYEASLTEVPGDDFYQTIFAGNQSLEFHFQWQSIMEEMLNEFEIALRARAQSDPWINAEGSIRREYDWLEMYCKTIPHRSPSEIQAWLIEYGYAPQSLRRLSVDLIASNIFERCKEAEGILYYLTPFYNQSRWNVAITDSQGNVVTGVVESGGWLNNQSTQWKCRFVADRSIGHDDLLNMKIQFEVAE